MLLFRSEEHVQAWYRGQDLPEGGALTLQQQWQLARMWYGNRASPDWRKFTPDEAQAAFRSVGLTSDFWRLVASGT